MAHELRAIPVILEILIVLTFSTGDCCAASPMIIHSNSSGAASLPISSAPVPADNRPHLSTGMDYNTYALLGGLLMLAGLLTGLRRKRE